MCFLGNPGGKMSNEAPYQIFTFDQKNFTKCKWPELSLSWSSSKQLVERQQWIYNHISAKHAMWIIHDDCAIYKFRYERDLMWFKLSHS